MSLLSSFGPGLTFVALARSVRLEGIAAPLIRTAIALAAELFPLRFTASVSAPVAPLAAKRWVVTMFCALSPLDTRV